VVGIIMWARLRARWLLCMTTGLSVVCVAPRSARAEGDDRQDPEARPIGGRMDGGMLVVGSDYGLAVGLDGAALLRGGVLAIGPELSLEAQPASGGYSRLAAGLRVGFVFALGDSVDLDLLGSVGGADYENVGGGSGLFTPRASGALPYVGARTGLSFTIAGRRRTRIQLGAWAIYTNEIGRKRAIAYAHCGFFNCEGQHSVNIGTERYGGVGGVVVNFE
jgi:hypothetical protein